MKNIKVTLKLIIFVSILGIVCVFAIGYVSIKASNRILNQSAINYVKSVQLIKKAQVEDFLSSKANSLKSLEIISTVYDIFEMENKNTSDEQKAQFTKDFTGYLVANGFNELMFVDAENGSTILHVQRNRQSGSNQDISQISNLWHLCLSSHDVVYSDIMLIDNMVPKMYVGISIRKQGKTVGVIIAGVDLSKLNSLLQKEYGITESGETYLVGGDRLFRSESRFSQSPTTLRLKAQTDATNKVFSGQQGVEFIKDYRNIDVLSTFNHIDNDHLNWAIITEVDEAEILKPKNDLIFSILVISIIVLIVMFPSLYLIGRFMVNPLKLEIEYANKLAKGDLNAVLDINQNDEMGMLADALREMTANMKTVISNVANAANNLADASFQLSSTSQNISTGASEQASSVEEVSASVEEMTSNIQQNADNAKQTEEITTNVSKQVTAGSDIVLSSVESMEKIADKISIISDIAFQTNILALNAAVEAARAGEYGKGFGVVASEVGKLAEKTKTAASEINEISKSSVEIAGKTKDLMGALVPSIQNSSMLVQEISAASKEQREAADQINDSIQLLNDISQQNAASSEEMATNSEELASQSEQLLNVISHFKIDGVDIHRHTVSRSVSQQRLIEDKPKKPAKTSLDSGININLADENDLDDEFEKF